jgi:pyruvate dehydrogenase E2 component (dihydrolipoamide acetyltransferase)
MALVEVKVPDMGDFKDVEIIEVLVKVGDAIKEEQSLITVESDKASMEIPSSAAGVVKELKVKVGDKVNQGSLMLLLDAAVSATTPASAPPPAQAETAAPPQAANVQASEVKQPALAAAEREALPSASAPPQTAQPAAQSTAPIPATDASSSKAHASPSARAFARELGVDIARVNGTGPKGRITHDDIRGYVKGAVAAVVSGNVGTAQAHSGTSGGGGGNVSVLDWPKVDFTKFGEIETKPLSRIKKISGANLHRNWVMIPHVTNHDDADITDLEAFRVQLNDENAKNKDAVKVTMLAFLVKACVAALKKFPEFNASLDGENLVLKKYFHIGFAADTPNGLVVPVIKDANKKGIFDIAKEMGELAALAREGKLSPAQMSGGCFSVSSLGGIGGTYFTPIINAPEVAILGVCRSNTRPVWNGTAFAPRLILPLSLSWDHRVIDGAAAARFNTYLASILADFRRTML